MIYQFYDFFSSNFCSVSFSRLKYTSHSKTCQIGAGTSMIRQFHDFFGQIFDIQPNCSARRRQWRARPPLTNSRYLLDSCPRLRPLLLLQRLLQRLLQLRPVLLLSLEAFNIVKYCRLLLKLTLLQYFESSVLSSKVTCKIGMIIIQYLQV